MDDTGERELDFVATQPPEASHFGRNDNPEKVMPFFLALLVLLGEKGVTFESRLGFLSCILP